MASNPTIKKQVGRLKVTEVLDFSSFLVSYGVYYLNHPKTVYRKRGEVWFASKVAFVSSDVCVCVCV